MKKIIIQSVDEFRFLSSFYPTNVFIDDIVYSTVEHAYQASKAAEEIEDDKNGT